MKKAIQLFGIVCVLVSISNAAYDYVISDTYQYVVRLEGNNSLLVEGAGAEIIDARGNSTVDVLDTLAPLEAGFGGIWGMMLNDNSELNYYKGETGDISFSDNATAILQGGSIGYIISRQYVLSPNQNPFPHIEVVCDVESVGHDIGTNILTGNWLDGSGFEIQLVDVDGYDPVIDNMFFTPEPASLMLLGLGVLFVRNRKRV